MSGICLIENKKSIDFKGELRNNSIKKKEDTHNAL